MSVVSVLRSGEWLNADRIKSYPIIFLAIFILASIYWVANSTGYLDPTGKPLGTDFLNQYAASKLVLDGTPELAYNIPRHAAVEAEIVGTTEIGYYGWHYPPVALLIVAPFALVSYGAALAIWMLLTLALNIYVVRKIADIPGLLLPALAFPAVIINIGHGHNGFLSASLLGGALYLLARNKQLAAGVLIGLLVYKPQFGMLIPVALIAGAYWRTILAAAITVILFVAISWLALGAETWAGFEASTEFTRSVVLEQGATGWQKIQSFFSLVRGLGGGVTLAYAIQTLATAVLAVLVFCLWRSKTSFNIKAAGLIIASLASTPYLLDYDLIIMGLAITYLCLEGLKSGFRAWEKSLLALLWLWPLVARSIAEITSVQVTPLLLGLLMWALMTRSRSDSPQLPQ
jgi:alpha-1,2-mannosyltransferase